MNLRLSYENFPERPKTILNHVWILHSYDALSHDLRRINNERHREQPDFRLVFQCLLLEQFILAKTLNFMKFIVLLAVCIGIVDMDSAARDAMSKTPIVPWQLLTNTKA
jgi:hypothetical protein